MAAAVEAAGLASIDGAISDAGRLRDAGSWSAAVSEYNAVAHRSGVVYLLARSRIDAAATDAGETTLDWARALAAAGHVDEALEMAGRVTDPALVDAAHRTAAQIGIDDARRQAAAGRPDRALARLAPVVTGLAPADLVAQAAALRPPYAIAAARLLLGGGMPEQALAALDGVLAHAAPGPLTAQAQALLPQALLAAGQAALGAHDEATALLDLDRLVDGFGDTAEAARARDLLALPQPVTGTLVHRDGSAAPGVGVRLGSDYRRLGSGFETSPPYYYARTDARGEFAFDAIPVGAHLTLEILDGGAWTVLEADSPDPAAQKPLYAVDVSPLTPVDLAFVRLPA